MTQRLLELKDQIAIRAEAIRALFKPGAKVTIVVTQPAHRGDAGVVVTGDDIDTVIAELQRAKERRDT